MSSLVDIPQRGQIVTIRQRRFVVTDVSQRNLPPDILKPLSSDQFRQGQHLVTLESVEDDALGEDLQVVWELEPGVRLIQKSDLPALTGADTPARQEAFLNAVRWGAASSADVKALQAPFRSGVEIEDYQLDPVARSIGMPRVNLLIADDVGLGKTIEAGLVAQELIIRHRARRILVVCPAALQVQWRDQMREKFGLEFRIVDTDAMKVLRRERGLHVNPWTHYPRLITSVDFLKRDRPLRLMREALPAENESPYPRRFDLLIVDEAHNCAPSGRGQYATDSQRTTALRLISPHFEHKLFLSATPHNGYQESFSALLELLDNQRFARGVKPDRERLAAIMIRRLKSDLKADAFGTARFAARRLEAIEVDYTPDEKQAHRWLQDYTKSRLDGLGGGGSDGGGYGNESSNGGGVGGGGVGGGGGVEHFATEFVLKMLKKRLFSCPAAFAATLAQHEISLANAKKRPASAFKPTVGILRRQVDELDEETDNDDVYEDELGNALDTATPLFRPPTPAEQQLLTKMRQWAETATARRDSKARKLIEWLKEIVRPGGVWSNERVIIFTEYRATQKWLAGILAEEEMLAGERTMLLYGGMQTEERERIKAAFQAHPAESPVRILLATDAASEGIDLQNYCHRLIHYEIPWNPNRMEQRNGRIDRHGQKASDVLIYHFVGSAYRNLAGMRIQSLPTDDEGNIDGDDLEADLEFLLRAARKVDRIREDLGKVGPVIAERVEKAMLGRSRSLDTRADEQKAAPARALLRFEQKLRENIERLHRQLEDSRVILQLTPENVREVVQTALELAGQKPLRARLLTDPHGVQPPIEVYDVPDLTGSWALCTEGLAHPFTGRRRPVVFDHFALKGRDDVVLAHLNHRLVTLSLQLLRAEAWAADVNQARLHRVAVRVLPDSRLREPVVLAHARLLVLGGDSQRLHEEVIVAGGRLREGRAVERFNQTDLSRALELAQNHTNEGRTLSSKRWLALQAIWPTLQQSLRSALEARMRERNASLGRLLEERAQSEINAITAVLTQLRDEIRQELPQGGMVQLQLAGFTSAEREQFERNMDALTRRLEEIPAEIEQETALIRARFADPHTHLFPVAVTFLIPESQA